MAEPHGLGYSWIRTLPIPIHGGIDYSRNGGRIMQNCFVSLVGHQETQKTSETCPVDTMTTCCHPWMRRVQGFTSMGTTDSSEMASQSSMSTQTLCTAENAGLLLPCQSTVGGTSD